jgi:hypothetical protein
MKARTRNGFWLLFTVLGSLLLQAAPAKSQDVEPPTVHWAYASYFGTGWYRISDQQSAFIANLAPEWISGPATWLGDWGADAVYRIRVPVTVGVARLDFDDVPGILDPENLSTASIGLSADVDVPLSERFSFRPSAQLSYGAVLGESEYAWTYRGDVRARYRFGSGKRDWALIGALGAVAYDGNNGANDSFSYVTLATELAHPLRRCSTEERKVLLYWHVGYTDLLDRIGVQGRQGQFDEITNYWQAGLAFGKKDEDIKLWFLRFERLGLSYNVSPSGDLRGIKFVFHSLYEI